MAKSVTRTYLNKVKSLLNDTNTNIKALSNVLVEKGILDSSFNNKACTAGDILAGLAEYESWHPVLMSEDEEAAAIAEFDDINASGTAIKTKVISEMPIKGYGKDGLTYIDPTDISKVYNSINNTTVATDRADGDKSIKRWTSRSIFKFLDYYYKYDRRKFEIPVKDIRNGLFLRKGNDLDGIVDKNGLDLYPYPEEIIMISEKKESNFIHFINAQYTDAHYGHFNGRNYNFMIVRDRERIGKLNSEGTGFEKYLSVYANDVDTELAYIDKKDDGEWYWNIPVPDKVYGEEMLDSMWDVRIVWRRDEPDRSFSVSYDLEVQEMEYMKYTQGTIEINGSYTWSTIAYGNGVFIAFSNDALSSSMARSKDGIHWESIEINAIGQWQCMCYGDGKFVVLDYDGDFSLMTNDGGDTWNIAEISRRIWYSVCYGNGKFVTVAKNTSISAYSSDGITWTESKLPANLSWSSVCYGKDKFVAVAKGDKNNANTNIVAYSSDGIRWSKSTLPIADSEWSSVCYGKDKFVAITSGTNIYGYSSDGITWTQGGFTKFFKQWTSICYGDDKFVIIAKSDIYGYSSDGITWTQGTLPENKAWTPICYGDGKFVLINKEYGINVINICIEPITISNALDFDIVDDRVHLINKSTENVAITRNQVTNYAEYSGEKNIMYEPFLLNSAGNIVSGSDFSEENKLVDINIEILKETQGTMPNAYCASVCYGKDKFIAIPGEKYSKNTSNAFAYSLDGIAWTEGTLPSSQSWSSICYGNGKFVIVSGGYNSSSKIFAYSSDGITWTQITLPFTVCTSIGGDSWTSVCYGEDKFVAIARTRTSAIYSSDGITWTYSDLGIPSSYTYSSICYGEDKFVIVATGTSRYLYSSDGITWTEGTLSPSQKWEFVCYGEDKFVATAQTSDIFAYSSDGITWTGGTLPSSHSLYSVCYGKDKFVTVGYNSDVFAYSSDGITWTEGTLASSQKWFSVCYGEDKFVAVAYNSDVFSCLKDTLSNPEQIPTQIFKLSPDSPVLPDCYIGFSYRTDLPNRGEKNGFTYTDSTTSQNIYAIVYDKNLQYQYNVNITSSLGTIMSIDSIEILQNKFVYDTKNSTYILPIVIYTLTGFMCVNVPYTNNKIAAIPTSTTWEKHDYTFTQRNYKTVNIGLIKNSSDNKYYKRQYLISDVRLAKYDLSLDNTSQNYHNNSADIPMNHQPILLGREKMVGIQCTALSSITKTEYAYDTSVFALDTSTWKGGPLVRQQNKNYAIVSDDSSAEAIVKLIEKYTFDKDLLANPTI